MKKHEENNLVVTQTLAMLQALALGALVLTGLVQVWQSRFSADAE